MFSLRLADSADTSVFFSEAIAQWQLTEKQHPQCWGVIYFSTSDICGSLTAWSQGHKVQALLQQIQNCLLELRALHKNQSTLLFQQSFPNLVGMAAAVVSSFQVCARPVTQRRRYASIPSSPFPSTVACSWKLGLLYTSSPQAAAAYLVWDLLPSQCCYSVSANTVFCDLPSSFSSLLLHTHKLGS